MPATSRPKGKFAPPIAEFSNSHDRIVARAILKATIAIVAGRELAHSPNSLTRRELHTLRVRLEHELESFYEEAPSEAAKRRSTSRKAVQRFVRIRRQRVKA